MKINEKIFKNLLGVFIIIALVSIGFSTILNVNAAETLEMNTTSSAQVSYYVAIGMSTDLGTGVNFGILEPTTINNNATNNSANAGNTTYYISVSGDSNAAVNLSIKDSVALTNGGYTIPNVNYTYSSAVNNSGAPALPGTAITTSYVVTNSSVAPGSTVYYRFWLDIAGSQQPGTYSNTIYFQATKS